MPRHSGRSRALLSVSLSVLVSLSLSVLELEFQLVPVLSPPFLARVGLRVWQRLAVQVSMQGL